MSKRQFEHIYTDELENKDGTFQKRFYHKKLLQFITHTNFNLNNIFSYLISRKFFTASQPF